MDAGQNDPMGDPLDQLPRAYRIGLRLRDLGASDDLIADCLEIDPEGIVTLLEIGAQKLANARLSASATNHDAETSERRS